MTHYERELQKAIEASLSGAANVDPDEWELQDALRRINEQESPDPFTSRPNGMSADLSMQEQLRERRARHAKRQADDQLREGSKIPRNGTHTSVPLGVIASGYKEVRGNDAPDMAMLLEGLDIPDDVKAAALKNPKILNGLHSQLTASDNHNMGEHDFDELGVAELASMAGMYIPPAQAPLGFTFRNGALRITRTPGRHDTPNCISIDQLIDKAKLVACCIYAFMIAPLDVFPYLPLEEDAIVPVYVGSDIHMCQLVPEALQVADITSKSRKLSKPQVAAVTPILRKLHKERYSQAMEAFFPYCQGCAHSKLLLLVYPTFLRIVITPSNLHRGDMFMGDNHWYIHDLPRFASGKVLKVNTSFEKLLTVHLRELGCPNGFFDDHFSGRFDFSSVKVSLVTSRPGTSSGLLVESSGLLRLRNIVSKMKDVRSDMLKSGVHLEYCAGSIGWLNAKWLKEFYDCATGRSRLGLAEHDCPIANVSVIFPSEKDIEECDEYSSTVAKGNIGSYMSWTNATDEVRGLFHHYKSKDEGKLFHMKLLLGLDAQDRNALPFFVYVGSANFSKGAWGRLAKVKYGDENDATRGLRLEECVNYECGVVIPREVLLSLLEPGSDWRDVVPYKRPADPYDLEDETCLPFRQPMKEHGEER